MLRQGGSSARGSALSHLSAAFIRLKPEAVQTMRERWKSKKKKGKGEETGIERQGLDGESVRQRVPSVPCQAQVQLGCVT